CRPNRDSRVRGNDTVGQGDGGARTIKRGRELPFCRSRPCPLHFSGLALASPRRLALWSLGQTSGSERIPMQRRRARAIAIAQQQVLRTRLAIAAALLLLPALLLLLISP